MQSIREALTFCAIMVGLPLVLAAVFFAVQALARRRGRWRYG